MLLAVLEFYLKIPLLEKLKCFAVVGATAP